MNYLTKNYLIAAAELARMSGDTKTRIIDCRFDLAAPHAGRLSYDKSHIPGAVFVDLDQDLASAPGPDTGRHPLPMAEELAATLGQLGIGRNNKVVVYDAASGAMAARTWWLLRWLGHDDVLLLDGGMAAWSRADLPLDSTVMSFAPQCFVANVRDEMVLTTEEVYADPSIRERLFDARDAARYRGEVEPIDPVAGHIPGARNLPFTQSLNADGTWKSTSELRDLWRAQLGAGGQMPWAVMCGSGVTACHLAISAMQAGFDEPRMYVGSWSEWIRDSERPIATIQAAQV